MYNSTYNLFLTVPILQGHIAEFRSFLRRALKRCWIFFFRLGRVFDEWAVSSGVIKSGLGNTPHIIG